MMVKEYDSVVAIVVLGRGLAYLAVESDGRWMPTENHSLHVVGSLIQTEVLDVESNPSWCYGSWAFSDGSPGCCFGPRTCEVNLPPSSIVVTGVQSRYPSSRTMLSVRV